MASKSAELLLKIKTAGQESLEKIKSSLGGMADVAKYGFTALVGIVTASVYAFKEQEDATNSLSRALVNNGNYSKALKDDYLAQAAALQKVSLFGDEQIIQAQSMFTQQAKSVQLTKENTRAILDFAQAQGMDLASAANLVGKSIGTSTNALARYGIEVNKNATEQEKMAQVMAGLNSKFGGQAEAATQGLGSIKVLQNAFSDFLELIGERAAPIIVVFSKYLTELVSDSNKTSGAIDFISDSFTFLAKSAAIVINFIAGVTESIGAFIGAVFGTYETEVNKFSDRVIEKIKSGDILGALKDNFSGSFGAIKESLSSGLDAVGNVATQRAEATAEALDAINAADNEARKQKMVEDENNLKESLERKSAVKAEAAARDQQVELQRMIEDSNIKTEQEIALMSGKDEQIFAAQVAAADKKLSQATTDEEKALALKDKFRATELMNEAKKDEALKAQRSQTLNYISSLQNSKNKELAAIGKAAAIAQATIDGWTAVQGAYKWGSVIGGPPLGAAFAAAAGAAMAANIAGISGVQLAEGGIVMPRPGGIQATIGEAGQAEAVIPLDRAGEFGLGGGGANITLNVYGGILGNENEAREFALVLDKELLKLRRNNESQSFDDRVI